uniref:Protein broad-minded n=1 Tax=Electrophorus electricus TaxID=8005 RepID=A0A4W4ES49_ELEEL
MSQFSVEDEAEVQSLLRQLLRSVKERISGAPSVECAEEILLHLEETDKNFHNYEFVKYLRHYVESTLGAVIEEETESCATGDGHAIGSAQDTLVHVVTRRTRESAQYKQMMQALKQTMMVIVESLLNKFEEDQLKKEEMNQKSPHEQFSSHYTDNCSDSDSSFNQSYAFIRQEQLQVISEKLDPSRPKEVRWEALQLLCCAPPSDVLSCENWSGLHRNLSAALSDPDPDLSETFKYAHLNVHFLFPPSVKSLESDFLHHKLGFPADSSGLDVNRPYIARLLKQVYMRLMNDFQKEVTTFWIRHPEKYMEEIIESTLGLLSVRPEHGSVKSLEPVHLLSLLDIQATWFKKWMHGYYSRTVVLRLLERKYKSMIVAAVQQCIYYYEEEVELGSALCSVPSGPAQRNCYSAKELEYTHFVHSVCLLGRLLMYTNGRKLFPIKVRKRRDPVTLTNLVVILISIMYQRPNTSYHTFMHACVDSLSPAVLVMEVLRQLCERTGCAVECIYQVPVVEALLVPILALLRGKPVSKSGLTHIADTLARIATTECGLALFLYERKLISAEGEGMTAAHIIVRFAQALLAKELPACAELEDSAAVKGAFIFVCRQMYNTGAGLQVLGPYGLHECIAQAWRKVTSLLPAPPTPGCGVGSTSSLSERVPTPVPGAPEVLLDNLLNFAATPKGLLLLQQTGAIQECVTYMFSRFTQKLQVWSRCEKFGYGVMVTQVAATAPGIMALRSSGFIQAMVVELWSVLECGREDVRVVHPKSTPMDPVDKSCVKSFLTLVNLLSSAHAVWELLCHQVLPNKSEYSLREMPTSVIDVMDRLVVINSDAKIHSLFNYEQSHTFGLRLLSVMCCSLDSLLLLESQYKLSDILLQSQEDNAIESSSGDRGFIIDGLSVERHHLLVRMSVTGGPSERSLPPRSLQKVTAPLLHSQLPAVSQQHSVKHGVEHGVTHLFSSATALHTSTEVCMSLARYGLFLKLLKEDSEQDLCNLLRHTQEFLSQQRLKLQSDLRILCYLQRGYPGHDWFASTVFLLLCGDADRSLSLLLRFSRLLTSAFLWQPRIYASVHLPLEIAQSGVPPLYSCTAHYVEMLLKAEVPLVSSAFRMSGFTPSQMCMQWLGQCFWNYLDWSEICHYVATCIIMGPDYQVYMCVSVLKHLQRDILQHAQTQDLQVFLKEEPIRGYRVSDYLDYMEALEHSYRAMVLTDMESISPKRNT